MTPTMVMRHTVAGKIELGGKGLHGGRPVTITISPASNGIEFTCGNETVPAVADRVTDTTRSTTLGPIHTVEHLMSAFAGLEITDAHVQLTSPELPGLDGSSRLYVEALLSIGTTDLGMAEKFPPFKRLFLQQDGLTIAAARGTGRWRYEYDLGARWPGLQTFEAADVVAEYREGIAPARTFALEEEIPFILKAGLAQGLDADSALVLGPSGYVNPSRFADEPARHKLLDLMGDLYLSGIPVRLLDVVAVKSGHRSNVDMAKLLWHSSVRSN